MAGFGSRMLKWSYERVKSRDIYKQSVSLTFKGKEGYTMIIGGICSIILFIILIIFGGILVQRVFSFSDVEWNQNDQYLDLDTSLKKVSIKESDHLYLFYSYRIPNDLYSNYTFKQIASPYLLTYNGSIGGTGELLYDTTKTPDLSCDKEKYTDRYTFPTSNTHVGIGMCLDLSNKTVSGNPENLNGYDGFHLVIEPWYAINGTNCLSKSLTDQILRESFITIAISQIAIDLNNITHPVSEHTGQFFKSLPDTNKVYELKLLVETYELLFEDFWLTYNPFASFETKHSLRPQSPFNFDLPSSTGHYKYILAFGMDNIIHQKKRKVLNLFEVTGILGGISEVFDIFIGFFIGIISHMMFKKELRQDLSKAEKQYKELKLMINELKDELNTQNEASNLQNNQQHPNENTSKSKLLREEAKIPNAEFQTQMIQNLSRYRSANKAKSMHKDDGNQANLLKFGKGLDWVNIVYSIKTLNKQMAYLLQKDKLYTQKSQAWFKEAPEIYKRNLNISHEDEAASPNINYEEHNADLQSYKIQISKFKPSNNSIAPNNQQNMYQNPMVKLDRVNRYRMPEEEKSYERN